jgi:hypothetical protein
VVDPTRSFAGAEVGVYKGETSAYLLRELPGLTLYAVDCWHPGPFRDPRNQSSMMAQQKDRPDVFAAWEREARSNTAFAGDRCRILKADFRDAAELIPDGSLEFVFLDAAHSYRDTMEQILWYWPKVREGGLVTGHDYGYPRAGYEVVAQAVDAAARFFRADLHVDKGSYVWWWRKGK